MITELLQAPWRYLSDSSSLKTLVPATSKICPAGLKRNAMDPLEIFDQVIDGLKKQFVFCGLESNLPFWSL